MRTIFLACIIALLCLTQSASASPGKQSSGGPLRARVTRALKQWAARIRPPTTTSQDRPTETLGRANGQNVGKPGHGGRAETRRPMTAKELRDLEAAYWAPPAR